MVQRLTASLVIVAMLSASAAAVGSRKAEYVGGTVSSIADKTEGSLNTQSETTLVFTPERKGSTPLTIPYAAITELEYGQKAGRRVAVGILITPWALFSKKRKHFLTVSYSDAAQKEQAVVLELGKDIIRTTLTIVETRSGKEIQYQDDEARKAGRGGDD